MNPSYIRLFDIIGKVGVIAYQLELPPELANMHNVFYVSMFQRYLLDPIHAIIPEPLEVREDITYIEHLVRIFDQKEQVLGTKAIPLVIGMWRNHSVEEATWEREDKI